MAKYKGHAIVYGSPGVVTLAGNATAFNNSTMDASTSDASDVQYFKDGYGATRTAIRPEETYALELTITPGVGDGNLSSAQVKALAELVNIGDTIVTSGFDIASFNWNAGAKGFITAVSVTETSSGAASLKVSAMRKLDSSGVALDFTAAWTSL